MSNYYMPQNLEEGLRIKASRPDAVILAGGTDLMVRFRKEGIPDDVIDVSAIKEIHELSCVDNSCCIGALTAFTQLSDSIIAKDNPVLGEAISQIGSTQIRNRGTIGGNICNANPAADLMPLWGVWGAEIELAKIDNNEIYRRRIPVLSFVTGYMRTCIQDTEIMTRLVFQKPKGITTFCKVAKRDALAISRISAAVSLSLDKQVIKTANICIGAVSETLRKLENTEQYLIGKQIEEIDIDFMSKTGAMECFADLPQRASTAYKKIVVRNILKDLIQKGVVEKE